MAEPNPFAKFDQPNPFARFDEQSLTSASPSNPITKAMGRGPIDPIDDPVMMPGMDVQAIASLPTDSTTRGRYFASKLFPQMSPDDAMSHMGIRNGRWFYVNDKGRAFYAEPEASLKDIGKLPASLVGPALPMAGSIAGGVLTEPVAGGIIGAAGGASVGDAIRQGAANIFAGEDKSVPSRVLQNVGEAAKGGIGQGIGVLASAGLGALVNRNPLGVEGYDVGLLNPQRVQQMEAAQQAAQGMGVTITPGEAGNVRSLLARQRQLGRNDRSATALSDFYAERNATQVPGAWDSVMSGLSGQSAPGLGARQLAEGAQGTIDATRADRIAQAKPLYQSVMQPSNVMAPQDYAALMQGNTIASGALESVRSDPVLASSVKGMPDESLPVLDLAKRRLDDMYDSAMRSGERNRARIIGQARDDFVQNLDSKFPGYADARKAYAGASPDVDELENGIVGMAAKDRANAWQGVPKTVFDATSSDPLAISNARNAYQRAGRMDEWNAGLRSYLDNVFAQYAKQSQGPSSGIVRNVWDDTRQRANLKAAMTPDQFDAFKSLVENVLRPVSRAPAEGSPTATDLGASFTGGAIKKAISGLRSMRPWDVPSILADHLENRASGAAAERIVDLITQPGSAASLRRLRMITPGTQGWINEVGNLATGIGINSAIPGPADMPPSAN